MAITSIDGFLARGRGALTAREVVSKRTIKLTRGDSATVRMLLRDDAGMPVDMTGDTLTLSVRLSEKYAPVKIAIAGTVTPALGVGYAEFAFVPANTVNWEPGRYLFDVVRIVSGVRDTIVPASALTLTSTADKGNAP